MATVIAGFPGVGKSYFTKVAKERGLTVLDSDSSTFSWIKPGERNPEFPQNYIEHIQEKLKDPEIDFIMVSTHKDVRDALKQNQIDYTLVYPHSHLKSEYLRRYNERGNDKKFIDMMDANWAKFLVELTIETFPKHIELSQGEYLGDIIDKMLVQECSTPELKVGLIRPK